MPERAIEQYIHSRNLSFNSMIECFGGSVRTSKEWPETEWGIKSVNLHSKTRRNSRTTRPPVCLGGTKPTQETSDESNTQTQVFDEKQEMIKIDERHTELSYSSFNC